MSLTQKLDGIFELCKMIDSAGINYSSKINKQFVQTECVNLSSFFKGDLDELKTDYQFSVSKICYLLYVSNLENCIYQIMNKALLHSKETLKNNSKKYKNYPNELITKIKKDLYPFSTSKIVAKKLGKEFEKQFKEIIEVRNYIAHGEKEESDLKSKTSINIVNDLHEVHRISKELIIALENYE